MLTLPSRNATTTTSGGLTLPSRTKTNTTTEETATTTTPSYLPPKKTYNLPPKMENTEVAEYNEAQNVWYKKLARVFLPKSLEDDFGVEKIEATKPEVLNALTDGWENLTSEQQETAKDIFQKELPTEQKTKISSFAKSMSELSAEDLPYIGSGIEAVNAIEIVSIYNKVVKGTATDQEMKKLNEYYDEQERQTEEMKNIGYKVGETIKGSARFMGELLPVALLEVITGSLAPSGEAYAASKLAQKGTFEMIQKILKDTITRGLVKKMIGVEAKTVALQFAVTAPTNITAGVAERMIGVVNTETGEVLQEGQSIGEALVNATTGHAVELLTERMGGVSGKVLSGLASPVKKYAVKTAIVKALQKKLPSASESAIETIVRKAGWNGVMGEWFEERDADLLNQALYSVGLGDQKFEGLTKEDVAAELIAFATMGAGIKVGTTALEKGLEMRKGTAGEEVVPTEEVTPTVEAKPTTAEVSEAPTTPQEAPQEAVTPEEEETTAEEEKITLPVIQDTDKQFSILPKEISVYEEAKAVGAKRIAPDRVPHQQLTPEQSINTLIEKAKKKAENNSNSWIKVADAIQGLIDKYGDKLPKRNEENLKKYPNLMDDFYKYNDLKKHANSSNLNDIKDEFLQKSERVKWNSTMAEKYKSSVVDEYKNLIKADISKGYKYPEEVLNFDKSFKIAVDNRARYEKGLATSFSADDSRIVFDEQNRIVAGMKRQDGKELTREQKDEIINGILQTQKVLKIDLNQLSKDERWVYVHLNGKNPFLMKDVAGLYRRGKNSVSISLGGTEGFDTIINGNKVRKQVNTVISHEIAHALDRSKEGQFLPNDLYYELKNSFKPTTNYGRGDKYWKSKSEVTARAIEEYVAIKEGHLGKFEDEGYWSKEIFDSKIKPAIEKAIDTHFSQYKIDFQTKLISKILPPKKPTKPKPDTTVAFSTHYERIKSRDGFDELGVEFDPITLEGELRKAYDFIQQDLEKALQIAYNVVENDTDINSQAIRTSLLRSFLDVGDKIQAQELARILSKEYTLAAQTLVLARTNLDEGTQLTKEIMEKRKLRLGEKLGKKTPEEAKDAADKEVKARAKKRTNEILTEQQKLSEESMGELDKLINSLIC